MRENDLKRIAAMLAALATAPCLAQTHMMMPEGSREVTIALGVANGPETEGGSRRETFVAPLLSAHFANGVFIDMNTVGIHLSRNPEWRYGLQLTPSISSSQVLTDQGPESRRRLTPEVGGFVRYHLAHGVGLYSSLMYGGSMDHRGVRLRLGANLGMPVAEHHHLGLDAVATLANQSSLHADFSVQPEPGVAGYDAEGGLRDTSVTASWVWQLSTKYALHTMLRWNRLHGSAARSPRIEQAGGTVALTVLSYTF